MSDIKSKRPISPYLTIYNIFGNKNLTSNLSFLNRFTGIINAVGLIFFSLWLVGAATSVGGEETFLFIITNGLFHGFWAIFGYTGLFLLSIAGFYHILNGIRYLIFDLGLCLELPQVKKTGIIVLTSLAILVACCWLLVVIF